MKLNPGRLCAFFCVLILSQAAQAATYAVTTTAELNTCNTTAVAGDVCELELVEADTVCAGCSGSINAISSGQYWYTAKTLDGTMKVTSRINVVAE